MSMGPAQLSTPVKVWLLLILLQPVMLLPVRAAAEDETASPTINIGKLTAEDEKTDSLKINIGKLSQGIKLHQEKIRKTREKETSVLDELAEVEKALNLQQEKIHTLQQRLLAQVKLLAEKDQRLDEAVADRDSMAEHLRTRLRSFYLMGKVGLLNVTFSNKSLPELMLFSDSFKWLISYDQSVMDSYRATVNQLKRARHAQELEKNVLQQFISQAEEEKKTLATLRQEKERLLTRIKTEKALYEIALKEMRKSEQELNQELAVIRQKQDLRKQEFMLNKGKLPPPVQGHLIQRYGKVITKGWQKGEQAKGITIRTTGEAAVRAIYKGTVTFAGYKRGYGNTVIIDHGYHYFTLMSRLDTIVVKEGDKVKQGSLLGSTSNMTTMFSEGLYFEIRYGPRTMDPLKWLEKNAFSASRP